MTTETIARQGTVEGPKEALIKDLKSAVGDANDLVKEAAKSTAEKLAAARTKIEGTLEETRSRLDDARISATEQVKSAAKATDGYVRGHPWKALGAAAATGLIIGILLGRRPMK